MTTLYGIKNCDSVKKARTWLESHAIDYTFHDFREDGITETLVNNWLKQQPLDKLINKRSTTFKQLDEATKKRLNIKNAAKICVEYETLVKRPVLDFNNVIYLGFDDKIYSALFNT